ERLQDGPYGDRVAGVDDLGDRRLLLDGEDPHPAEVMVVAADDGAADRMVHRAVRLDRREQGPRREAARPAAVKIDDVSGREPVLDGIDGAIHALDRRVVLGREE